MTSDELTAVYGLIQANPRILSVDIAQALGWTFGKNARLYHVKASRAVRYLERSGCIRLKLEHGSASHLERKSSREYECVTPPVKPEPRMPRLTASDHPKRATDSSIYLRGRHIKSQAEAMDYAAYVFRISRTLPDKADD